VTNHARHLYLKVGAFADYVSWWRSPETVTHTHTLSWGFPLWYSSKNSRNFPPVAGSRVVKTDPLCFLAGCHTRRLNQALYVLSLSLSFFWVCLLTGAPFFVVLFCVTCVFCLLVVLVRLSVPVQVTWLEKLISKKWPIMCWWGR